MFKFEKVSLLVLSASVARADTWSWTDDFTECNMYRLVNAECPDDGNNDAKRFPMIPATQRTDNIAGYALDVTPWSTDTQFWIKMEAYTPRLVDNSVFEMYVSVKDKYQESTTVYDTVKCATEAWNLG